ncbi:phage integrase N-terminal SAM-like domain-containing protein [Coleofasciculus sp. LEGE 07092]|uniref:phage integrase N-terminal SAM-like domain-containing protein n=1 Tax=Coleofasciculus sp. LEGE 07081 TaxID=2777967 RepID=UPI0018810F57|nr:MULTISPECIES: phage integrase N-terminal SAM-like domain-containing protein [unclassified Coleofasciculus]MBE9128085.1 phage integrase N-terminal SAM-like domain-containing protein [Coleofasciculus sp. LEGE 07081]MBE9146958.1 phage integrase N-terminal SAM-like domain-containing protein [Coleofasciculus sp. LEGE 07092]
MQPPPKKLLDQVRDAIRLKHYAYRTEETYVQWIRCYILFHIISAIQTMGIRAGANNRWSCGSTNLSSYALSGSVVTAKVSGGEYD